MRIKKNFYTGLLMILPVVITYYIFNWLFNLAFRIINNTIIIKILKKLVEFTFGEKADAFYIQMSVYIAAFLIIFLSITILGYMTKVVFFSKIIKRTMDVLERIPIIKTVYSTSKQIIGIVYSDNGESVYKKVVAVEFPRKGLYAIGFLTADKNTALKEILPDKDIVNVFVPTAPNPTSGFLLCIPKEEVYYLNMSVELAFKLIVSGGYITEDIVKHNEQKAEQKIEENN
ncbi:hypothetical protein HMPREF9093_01063 [Fusobacterium sp. oral taxon 370 str. F0437]|jgi:transporter|uniref:DUF502 domain-containing protein n=1 Tax=Fusobacterium sp. oral taxon 370 TaxID=712288 RepID=UPI000234AADE|nr:DUF502 domain-containing protein [Fusobacterium sp. oral taxon 370]EHI78671.1 hypothetical protein HMPREF9093_01063 [Fusobacterium sp. oral taxon 370 str. F0437]